MAGRPNSPSSEYTTIQARLRDHPDDIEYARSLIVRGNRLVLEINLRGKIKHRKNLLLRPGVASRFWVPNDPVIHISDLNVSGRDFNAPSAAIAAVAETNANGLTDTAVFDNLMSSLKQQSNTLAKESAVNLWHPILMGWEVAYTRSEKLLDVGYATDFLTSEYSLGEIELEGNAQALDNEHGGGAYYNRSILTPAAAKGMEATLVNRLVPLLYELFTESAGGKESDGAVFNSWLNEQEKGNSTVAIDPDIPTTQAFKDIIRKGLTGPTDYREHLRNRLRNYLSAQSPNALIRANYGTGEADERAALEKTIGRLGPLLKLQSKFTGDHETPLPIRLLEEEGLLATYATFLLQEIGKDWLVANYQFLIRTLFPGTKGSAPWCERPCRPEGRSPPKQAFRFRPGDRGRWDFRSYR